MAHPRHAAALRGGRLVRVRPLFEVVSDYDAELDALDAVGWLADPPPPLALVRAASEDMRAGGALGF